MVSILKEITKMNNIESIANNPESTFNENCLEEFYNPNHLLFVIKTSKYCNLRCAYCYEFSELALKHKISLSELGRIFSNINSYAEKKSIKTIRFVWHGGEPLLIPLNYYEKIGKLQKDTISGSIKISNCTQSNATICTDQHINFLKNEVFFQEGLGISFDVYGGSRVDIRGNSIAPEVIKNIQKYRDSGLSLGAIVVVERGTIDCLNNIFNFYDELNIPVRFLPYYKSDSVIQAEKHGLTGQEISMAFINLFDHWLMSKNAVRVTPLDDYIDIALRFIRNENNYLYDRKKDENIFIMNTDGNLWSEGEAYDENYTYGNLTKSPLQELIFSRQRWESIKRSEVRTEKFCKNCKFYGYCPGEYVANSSHEQNKILDTSGCPVSVIINHIVEVIQHIPDIHETISFDHKTPTFLNVS